jgi:hypothetical protein
MMTTWGMLVDVGGTPAAGRAGCKHHQLDPFACSKDILERLPTHPADWLGALLPDAWVETHPQARRKVAS